MLVGTTMEGEGRIVGGEERREEEGKERKEGKGRGGDVHLLDAFVLLLLGFEALAGGDGCLEVWGMVCGLAHGTRRRKG